MNHHPLKKLNLHTNIANNLRMSMYNTNTVNNNIPNSTFINDPTYHRLFTRKTTHSLDKINRGSHVHIVDTSNFQKQLLNATTSPTAKKLTSYQSTKNIHRSNSINNNNPNDLSFSPTRQHLTNYSTVMNHSSLGGNNTINNSTNNINNYTQSNINTTNQNKIKERLIQNLKNNFNQERIRRKKMLSVNVNVNLNQHYSMIHNNINDSVSNNNNTNNNNTTTVNESISNYNTQSYYDNSNTIGNVNLYKRNYFAKKDQPLKLYTDANAFNNNTQGNSNKKSNNSDNNSSNSNCNYGEGFRNRKLINSKSNHNLSLSTNNNNKHHNNSSSNNVIVNSMETFYDLELKMDKMLKENKSNSKSKKYNITKMIFEEGIKQFTILISNLLTNYPTSTSTHGYSNSMNYTNSNHNHYMENNNIIIIFLRNILKVYHESFLAYSNENKTLRDKVDKLQSSSSQLDKKLNDYSKQIKEKETEITSLKSQITKLTLSLSTKDKDKDKDKETITNIIKPPTTTTSNLNNNSTSLKTSSQIMPTDPRQVTFSATDDDLINSSIIPLNKHQEMIKDLNTKNINDLDALYFNDKVEMAESNRDISPKGGGHVVPKLNFGVMGSNSSSSSTMCGVGLANVHFNVPKIINNVYLKKN